MNIIVENLGKKFRNEWIFRGFNQQFLEGHSYAIIGPNGSGKSTLLQVISSYIPLNEGVIKYSDSQSKVIEIENIYQYISLTSPLLELIEDFSLLELIDFHVKLKPLANQISSSEFIDSLGLQSHQNKQIKFFSSGMKQKVKLGLCLFSNSPILFLDEPTTNLDVKTKEWFLENIQLKTQGKLIIIASNDPFEYSFSKNIIDIQNFK
ncbi:MAG: ATP-binding cassette domain-containing protein [Bacteroidota bacterium]